MDNARRHPSRMQLQRWFDGEAPDSLDGHLASCPQCLGYLDSLSRIRLAVRSGLGTEAAAAPEAGVAEARTRRHVSAPVLVALPVLLLLAAALVPVLAGVARAHGSAPKASALGSHQRQVAPTTASAAPDDPQDPSADVPKSRSGEGLALFGLSATKTSAGTRPGVASTPDDGTGHGPLTPAIAPLRLAVVVPTEGAASADGAEITQAAQKALAEANASGGVAGVPVQLDTVAAEDAAAVSALA
ncbi:MAG TPA: hypothetical protein VKR22_11020, partial [Acidimicrobiales bacterium]|nr:hypothetical protein [Acidimicrobiales bacterium]